MTYVDSVKKKFYTQQQYKKYYNSQKGTVFKNVL